MSRPLSQSRLARFAFPGLVCLLLLLSVLPTRFLGWSNWFGDVGVAVISPIAHPVTELSLWLSPGRTDASLDNDSRRALIEEAELWERKYLMARLQVDELREQVARLSGARSINPSVPVRPVTAPVIGVSSDPSATSSLRVRAGLSEGLSRGDVVTDGVVQLLGRVDLVQNNYAEVRPITSRAMPPIKALLMLDRASDRTLACLLRPAGDGTLRGDVEDPGDGPSPIDVGVAVRLRDEQWPESAQMLMIGRVVRVDRSPDQPLRKVVIVRPERDLRHATEVVIRVPEPISVTEGAP
ncbi:MAG: rod shape-determining protein MreC [Phycisphaerales bacterium JB059]